MVRSNEDKSNFAGQPVFTPIKHPVLRKYERLDVFYFLKNREKYISAIEDTCKTGGTIKPLSLKACINTELLENAVYLDEFGSSTNSLADVTDDMILRWLKADQENSLDSVTVDQIETAVRAGVQMRMSERDATYRVKSLFISYRKFLVSRNWEALIEKNPKMDIKHICMLLKPDRLQKKVESDLQLSKYELRKDWKGFFKYALKEAEVCERYFPLNQYSSSSSKSSISSTGSSSSSGRSRNNVSIGTSSNRTSDGKTDKNQEDKQQGKEKTDKEKPSFLNPNCTEKHFMRECKNTPADLKKKLVVEWRTKNNRTVNMVHLTNRRRNESDDGRFQGMIADTVPIVVNGDYGADFAALSKDVLQLCAEKGIYVQTLPLQEPLHAHLAMEDDESTHDRCFTSTKKVRLSVTLDTPAGPLRLRNVEFLVFPYNMREVLLSRPLLQTLGFDLPTHLSLVRDKFHDVDFANLSSTPDLQQSGNNTPNERSKLANALLRNVESPSKDANAQDPVMEGASSDAQFTSVSELYGSEDPNETTRLLGISVDQAVKDGLPKDMESTLGSLVMEFRDIFRSQLGSDPPAKIPPMKIRLKPGTRPFRAKVRKYSPSQAEFLRKKVGELLELGLVYRNPDSRWASAPHLVPKSGSAEQWRFTVDLRAVNKMTEPVAWPMPHLDTLLARLKGSTCFFVIDLCNGYWQMPLDKDSQECQSFHTEEEVVSPTRVLHGQTNAVFYFQSSFQQLIIEHRDEILQWLDDLLGHAKTVPELLSLLRVLFEICRKFGITLHAKKCLWFKTEVKWCGRIISKEGIRFDPRSRDALLQMSRPVTGGDLQQFLCALGWMRSSIPEFAKLVAPLQKLLERVYKKADGRTKQKAKRVPLSTIGWGQEEESCFEKVKHELQNSCTLAHLDNAKQLCLFTDASDQYWASVLTKIPPEDVQLEPQEQRHQPLAFHSGCFVRAGANWSTPEKEAFAIVESCIRLQHYLTRPNGFLLFTDHKNLTFIYNPYSSTESMARHVAAKIQRWAMTLNFHSILR